VNIVQGEKYIWRMPKNNSQASLQLASLYSLSLPIAQTLLNRGLDDKEEIEKFLFSSFEHDVSHASLLKDAQKSVDRILKAIQNKENILIFGDYDVDGITSSALMMICLLPLGAKVNFFLPNRVKDGYGISPKIVKRAAKNNYTVIITVDNGIAAFDAAKAAGEVGIDLIITDHHVPHGKLPQAFSIVNPNRADCEYPFKMLAGVGVTFKLLSLLYEKKGLSMPAKAYELLLLGTIADVVPLLGENRFWVRHGLQYVNNFESFSLTVLKRNNKVTKPLLSSMDIGYLITPQINALGRLQDPRQGVKFLLGSDKREVEEVGRTLFELNQARKSIERSILKQIQEEIDNKSIDLDKENIIVAASKSWPSGVIGLVASRLVSKYGKPALLFHVDKGVAKGSCRSIPEFNIFEALKSSCRLITKFGGHAHAAGLSLPVENIPELKENLEKIISQQLTPFDLKQKLTLDAQVILSDLNNKFIDDMALLEPFGNQNAQPIFYFKDLVQVKEPTLLKDEHVKSTVFADGVIKPVIFFGRPDIFAKLLACGQEPFDIAAHVVKNYWNGKVTIELVGVDIMIKNPS